MNTNKISGVYGLRCKINNKWYIGVSIDIIRRWHCGYELFQCKKQPKIYNAILKHGYDNFEKVILEVCDRSEFKPKETFWISKYDAVKSGYNAAPGGEGGFRPIGIPCSEETKRKIGLANTGIKHDDVFRQNTSKRFKGVKKSKEHVMKIANALRGTPLTEERRHNISVSLKGKFTWSDEAKLRMSMTRSKKQHPRWFPLSIEDQNFIRDNYKLKSQNWILVNMPTKISQKKLHRCITNLKNNPDMPEVIDFI